MAPEVLANQRYSNKADIYSFGMVMWECCARQVPFEGLNGVQAGEGNTQARPAHMSWLRGWYVRWRVLSLFAYTLRRKQPALQWSLHVLLVMMVYIVVLPLLYCAACSSCCDESGDAP